MAELLFQQGRAEVLAYDVGDLLPEIANELIRTAATTCYQSAETTKKSAAEFIEMLQKSGHHSVLEHSWATFLVTGAPNNLLFYRVMRSNTLFCFSEREEGVLFSGNARMFWEGWRRTGDPLLTKMLNLLQKRNQVLFSPGFLGNITEANLEELSVDCVMPETKWERLVHTLATVRFSNCSRGMTHEDVRSRNGHIAVTSYSQESTRYVDYEKKHGLRFALPYRHFDLQGSLPCGEKGVIVPVYYSPERMVQLMESWYVALRESGMKPEEARQWLPNGIVSQIVQSFNLKEWSHWFFLRTGRRAHPEIRFVALEVLKMFQERWPDLFTDIVVQNGDDGIGFAEIPEARLKEWKVQEQYLR